jgi:hypothetical protein
MPVIRVIGSKLIMLDPGFSIFSDYSVTTGGYKAFSTNLARIMQSATMMVKPTNQTSMLPVYVVLLQTILPGSGEVEESARCLGV